MAPRQALAVTSSIIECNNCSAVYIGETKHVLKYRMSEHEKYKNKNSVVSKYLTSNNSHSFDFSKVKILDREQNYKKRIVYEKLHINSCTLIENNRMKMVNTLRVD